MLASGSGAKIISTRLEYSPFTAQFSVIFLSNGQNEVYYFSLVILICDKAEKYSSRVGTELISF